MTTEQHPGAEEQQPEGEATASRRKFITQAAAATAVGVVAAGTAGYAISQRPGTTDKLVSHFHAGDLPISDPLSKAWTGLDAFVTKMVAQNITTPVQATVEVPELRVRSMHNGKQLAVHIEWADTTMDDKESIAIFRDACAIQFEVDPAKAPSFTMGNVDGPVHICQWRASWQTDVDEGHQGVKNLFPNAYNDVTPEGLMPKDAATKFYPARVANNSQAQHERTSPVEELTAIGFGSLTTHSTQEALGKGVYKNRRWSVVIALAMNGTDKTKASLKAGEARNIAFAVWNGSKGQRGARKQYFPWASMEVEAGG